MHWAITDNDGIYILRSNGYKALSGSFRLTPDGDPFTSYHFDAVMSKYISNLDFWEDHDHDVIFCVTDLVLDLFNEGQIVPELEKIKNNKNQAGFLGLVTHEQYFYNDYINYRPDYSVLILKSCEWAWKNGYKGSLISSCVSGLV